MTAIQTSTTHASGQVTSTGRAVDPLDLLARQAQAQENADRLDAQGADALPGADEAAPAMTNAQCLLMAGEILRETLCSFAKVQTPKDTLSNDKIQPAADALGAVFDKHGINLAGAAGDYMIEIKAGLIVIPLVLACRAGLQIEIADDKARQKAIAPGQAEAGPLPFLHPEATPHYAVG